MALSKVTEETDVYYTGDIDNHLGADLDNTNIGALTMTIYEETDGDIVNSRDQVDMRNGGSWDQGLTITTGTIALWLTADDNQIVNSKNAKRSEIHVVLFEGTTTGTPTVDFKHAYRYVVENERKVT